MSKLLKEAIADAKAVRETALQNAKLALEEAFTPKLQSMLSTKIQEEMEDEDEDAEYEEGMYENEDELEGEEELEDAGEEEIEMEDESESEFEDEDELEMEEEFEGEEEEEDLDLESVLKELEDDEEVDMEIEDDEMELEDDEMEIEDEEEEINIEEVINALREFDNDEDGTPDEGPALEDEDETTNEEVEALRAELDETKSALETVQHEINETNLLNSKLLFANKLFKNYELNEGQKLKVIESFDRAQTVREVKIVFATIAESLKSVGNRKPSINEGASKTTPTTAPKKGIISEGVSFKDRMQKLAGMKKK